jgi:xanthosine utilization system XapX-like protein
MGMRVPVVAAGIAASFCALTGVVILLALNAVVTPQRALLMLIALAGLYIGFGILILVRRLIDRLD